MSTARPATGIYYSLADYLTWPDEQRWELIDGAAYDVSPAPTLHM